MNVWFVCDVTLHLAALHSGDISSLLLDAIHSARTEATQSILQSELQFKPIDVELTSQTNQTFTLHSFYGFQGQSLILRSFQWDQLVVFNHNVQHVNHNVHHNIGKKTPTP